MFWGHLRVSQCETGLMPKQGARTGAGLTATSPRPDRDPSRSGHFTATGTRGPVSKYGTGHTHETRGTLDIRCSRLQTPDPQLASHLNEKGQSWSV